MEPLEAHLAQHCAPTVLGVKAGSMISLSQEEFPDLVGLLRRYNLSLGPRGLYSTVLAARNGRNLLLIYRPKLLERDLAKPEARRILHRCGYPAGGLGSQLSHLRTRLEQTDGIPHEIGLFLDYPPADVDGFLSGAPCRYRGYWKVYDDVEQAREKFACYDACRSCLTQYLAAGHSISQLLSGLEIQKPVS